MVLKERAIPTLPVCQKYISICHTKNKTQYIDYMEIKCLRFFKPFFCTTSIDNMVCIHTHSIILKV